MTDAVINTEFKTITKINTATNSAWIQGIVYLIEGELMREQDFYAELRRMTPNKRLAWIRDQEGFEEFPDHLQLTDWEFSQDNVANGFAFYCEITDEKIIGTAGTNRSDGDSIFSSTQFWMDINANISTGLRGGLPDEYFNNLRTLHERLLAEETDVSAVTGHSLGGAVAELFGMMYGIQAISYNPSPLRFAPVRGLKHGKVGRPLIISAAKRWVQIGSIMKNDNATPIRFVTHNDLLQWGVSNFNSPNGRTYIIPAGSGHGHDQFRFTQSLDFLHETWERHNKFTNEAAKIKISMSSGEFIIPAGMRVETSLMGNSEWARIKIQPADLDLASVNMRHRVGLRMETIKSGLSLATGQNSSIGSARSNRISTLARCTFDRIGNHGMTTLFTNFTTSYGLLNNSLPLLARIRDTSMPSSFTELFANRHGISKEGRFWSLGGSTWNRSIVTGAFSTLRSRIRNLQSLITNDPFANLYTSTHFSEHPMSPTTSVAAAYISRMNASVQQMMDALTGLTSRRSGSNDAIVSTMDDLFKTLETNISAAVSKNEELARNASLIASNHRNFDNEIAQGIRNSDGLSLNQHNHITGGPSTRIFSGELRLRTSNSLSSRENIIDVQRSQTETRTQTLNSRIQSQLAVVTNRLGAHARLIVDACLKIISAIDTWNKILDKQVTSRAHPGLRPSLSEVQDIETQWHLPLRDYLASSLQGDMTTLRAIMTNWEEGFRSVNTNARKFETGLTKIKNGLISDTLEMIYPFEEMHSKLSAVKGIGLLLETSAREYRSMSNELRNTMSGALITAYATDLEGTAHFYETIAIRIRQDFQVSWQ